MLPTSTFQYLARPTGQRPVCGKKRQSADLAHDVGELVGLLVLVVGGLQVAVRDGRALKHGDARAARGAPGGRGKDMINVFAFGRA